MYFITLTNHIYKIIYLNNDKNLFLIYLFLKILNKMKIKYLNLFSIFIN